MTSGSCALTSTRWALTSVSTPHFHKVSIHFRGGTRGAPGWVTGGGPGRGTGGDRGTGGGSGGERVDPEGVRRGPRGGTRGGTRGGVHSSALPHWCNLDGLVFAGQALRVATATRVFGTSLRGPLPWATSWSTVAARGTHTHEVGTHCR